MSFRFRTLSLATLLPLIALSTTTPTSADQTAKTPIPRLHQVDEVLYRGSQPDAEGFRYLRDLGIKTVVNFREEKDAVKTGEQAIVESLGMRYIHLPIKDGNFFTWFRTVPDETIKRFLTIVQTEQGPFYVHCRRGTDRTGAMVAFYRMARSGWDARRATDEANDVGMRFWYRGLRRQIKAFTPTAVNTQ
jgi:protein tyrosine/serine phosphatase